MLKVRGYAAVFGNLDSHNEIIDKGAFSDFLKANPNAEIPIFWEHNHIWSWSDPARPVGKTTMLREDDHGLYFEGELADTDKAEEIAALITQGSIKNASFAFRVKDDYLEDDIRHLSGIKLNEISPVNWGANDQAYIEPIPQESQQEPDA